jgi:TolB protein
MRASVLLGFALAAACLLATAPSAEGTRAGTAANAVAVIRNGNIYAVAVDGSRVVRLSRTHIADRYASVSPDGRSVAYSVHRKGDVFELWTMRIDGSHRSRLTHQKDDGNPVWSPDGRWIFFLRSSTEPISCRSIFRVGSDGRGVRRITRPRFGHEHLTPSVSRDERRVAFTEANSCEAGNDSDALRVADMSGHATRDLARLPGNKYYPTREYWSPTWSPDGKRLAFFSNSRLSVAKRDGSHLHTLSRLGAGSPFGASPAWSPDGKWIAFAGGSHGEIYLVHPDGSGLHRLPRTANAFSVSWLAHMPG